MIFQLTRQETRPNTNVEFYQYTAEDDAVYSAIPFFVQKTQQLSADGLVLTKTWEYDLSEDEGARLELIHDNPDLTSLNDRVYNYCTTHNIIRGELKGNIVVSTNNEPIEFARFPNKP
jgi:hypothetical protein